MTLYGRSKRWFIVGPLLTWSPLVCCHERERERERLELCQVEHLTSLIVRAEWMNNLKYLSSVVSVL